jgi:hypothetical protein
MDYQERGGGSFIRWEPPDICFLALVGDISAPDMRRLAGEVTSSAFTSAKSQPYILGLIDMSRVGAFDPSARAEARTASNKIRIRGTAVFGADFHVRVIATLVHTAFSVLNKLHDHPIRFFETEAEARAWLSDRRTQIAGELGAAHPS